jgi:hypothetical protein
VRSQRRQTLRALAAIAAMLLIGLLSWPGQTVDPPHVAGPTGSTTQSTDADEGATRVLTVRKCVPDCDTSRQGAFTQCCSTAPDLADVEKRLALTANTQASLDTGPTRKILVTVQGVTTVQEVHYTVCKAIHRQAQGRGAGIALKDGLPQLPTGDQQPDKPPQIWHQAKQHPTFARVYVGDGNSLELVSLQVCVTIEGPRARTVVDHTFRNPHDRQLEGTFEYPLPTGASPCYFAMFLGQTRDTVPPRFNGQGGAAPLPHDALARLTPAELVKQVSSADWGKLQEARVVSKEKALETYEDVIRTNIDPALLEYAGGNTFSGRVFPIPAKGYNRVLIAYEELLPCTQDKVLYRYPLPGCSLTELQFSLRASTAECRDPLFLPKDARKDEGGGQCVYQRTWTKTKPEGEVLFAFHPARPQIQAISGRAG